MLPFLTDSPWREAAPRAIGKTLDEEALQASFTIGLERLEGEAAVAELRSWLRGEKDGLPYRMLLQRELAAHGPEGTVIQALVNDADPLARRRIHGEIRRIMGLDAPDWARDQLVDLLLDKGVSEEDRRKIARNLTANPLGGKAMIPALARFLNRPDLTPWARDVAERALAIRGHGATRDSDGKWSAVPLGLPEPPSVAELARLPVEAAIPALREALARPDVAQGLHVGAEPKRPTRDRYGLFLAELVAEHGWSKAALALLADDSPHVRQAALGAVRPDAAEVVQSTLVHALRDSDPELRSWVERRLRAPAWKAPLVREAISERAPDALREAVRPVLRIHGLRLVREGMSWVVQPAP